MSTYNFIIENGNGLYGQLNHDCTSSVLCGGNEWCIHNNINIPENELFPGPEAPGILHPVGSPSTWIDSVEIQILEVEDPTLPEFQEMTHSMSINNNEVNTSNLFSGDLNQFISGLEVHDQHENITFLSQPIISEPIAMSNISEPMGQELIVFNQQQHRETPPYTGKNKRKFVLEKDKDEKYWTFRKKNTEATKKCRALQKIKINETISTNRSVEIDLNDLKEKHKKLKKKYKQVEFEYLLLHKKLTAISKLCEIPEKEE